MAATGSRKSWETGGLTFSQPNLGTGDMEADDVWDDRAILKAFDDALNSHTRKPVDGVEARKWNKHAAKAVADQALTSASRMVPPPHFPSMATPRGVASRNTPAAGQAVAASPRHPGAAENGTANGHGQGQDQGFQAADRRFASLLAKGNAEALSGGPATASARGMRAGIPGPWEPVGGSSEGPPQQQQHQQYQGGMPQDDTAGQRFDYARPGPHDSYPRPEDYGAGGGGHGANGYPYPSRGAAPPHHPPPPPHPLGGGVGGGPAASFEDGGMGRNGLPPPPAPPHPGVGPHAAAFQSLDGVPDDDLADLLLAWYYSGYYTGRYRAMQEARRPRTYRRHYHHPPHPTANIPPGAPPPPTPSTYHGGGSVAGGEGWGGETQGWHGGHQQPPSSPAGSGRGSISRRVY